MPGQRKNNLINIARALRLPFISASALPFIFGSFIETGNFNALTFLLGLLAVISTHLSANLINDYADSKTKADWQDKTYYNFFGGSKLIQEGVFSERFYFRLAVFFAALAICAAISLSLILKSVFIMPAFLAIVFLGWAYSVDPFKLSYRRFGEIIIFALFGPVTVLAGYFLQTGVYADLKAFMLSLPFGFLTAAILYANEVPDFIDDKKAGKFNLVSVFGSRRAYLFYYLLIFAGFIFIALNTALGMLHPAGLFSLSFAFIAVKAAAVLQRHPHDKRKLVESSKLTIAVHTLVSLILIIGLFL